MTLALKVQPVQPALRAHQERAFRDQQVLPVQQVLRVARVLAEADQLVHRALKGRRVMSDPPVRLVAAEAVAELKVQLVLRVLLAQQVLRVLLAKLEVLAKLVLLAQPVLREAEQAVLGRQVLLALQAQPDQQVPVPQG